MFFFSFLGQTATQFQSPGHSDGAGLRLREDRRLLRRPRLGRRRLPAPLLRLLAAGRALRVRAGVIFLKKNYFFVHTRCFPKSIVAVMSFPCAPPPPFSLEKKFPSEKESPQKRIFMQIVYCHIVNNPIFVLRLKYCEEIVRTILHVVRHVRNNKQ